MYYFYFIYIIIFMTTDSTTADLTTQEIIIDTASTNWQTQEEIISIEQQILTLQKQLAESQEITKKAQYDYINSKMDLDRLQKRVAEQETEYKITCMIDTIKKFIPAIEDMRKSVEHIPIDQLDTPLAKGINMVYNNIIKILEQNGITSATSIGLEPDSELHEPMGLQPAPSADLKNKIISEFSRSYIYQKNNKRIIVQSAKVIIWE